MKAKLILFMLLTASLSHAQWSTSPYADNGLYVCPGFVPGVVTYEDGSSIVLGILSSYIFAQKLDPEGDAVWPEPVVVHHNDSSDMFIENESDREWFCSDGDGGVIVFWQDYRDAYLVCGEPFCEYKNNSTYMQRIDKDGNKCWGDSGIKVSGIEDGLKDTRITADGEGGCALLMSESQFGYPGAANKNYLKILRYNRDGERLWQTVLDSSFSIIDVFQLYNIIRGGVYYYFDFLKFPSNFKKIFKENGNLNSYRSIPAAITGVSPDGNAIFLNEYSPDTFISKITKLNYNADTVWTETISYKDFCSSAGGGGLIPDNNGGTYLTHVCNDSLIYFDFEGSAHYLMFEEINYGGLIIAYWSTIGGIFVQHTGRNGELGIVTSINKSTGFHPKEYELSQNYPNPFNASTTIRFSIRKKSNIKISITNILGQNLDDLVNHDVSPGSYKYIWDAYDYASGVYFYSLFIDGKQVSTKKLLLTK